MNLNELLHQAENLIASYHIADAQLEAEHLLMHSLAIGRAELYIRLEESPSASDIERFWRLVEQRCGHEPAAYILKQCQFYGIDFYIDSRALIPRPESELLVEIALDSIKQHFSSRIPFLIADVGTGSGVLAISLALHLTHAKIYAIDISAAALEVASINCQQHGVKRKVELLLGDMVEPLPEPVNIIVANLPYVTDSELIQLIPEIKDFEPITALSGGSDGLDKIRQLLPQTKRKLLPGGLILFEIGQGQGTTATALVQEHFPDASIELVPDLSGIERVVKVVTQA